MKAKDDPRFTKVRRPLACPARPIGCALTHARSHPHSPLRPRLAWQYFKMVNYGVPPNIVRDKLRAETGHDPSLLDNPDAPAPPGGGEQQDSDEDDDDD